MEEHEELENQLTAVRDELLDRDEDPEPVDLFYLLLDWLYDAGGGGGGEDTKKKEKRKNENMKKRRNEEKMKKMK